MWVHLSATEATLCEHSQSSGHHIRLNAHHWRPVSTCLPQHLPSLGSRIVQWFERWTHDWKVAGSNPCRNSGQIFFSRVNCLCWLLFQYPFHPCGTAVARKRSRSFCQKCRWLNTHLCMKWRGAWLYSVPRTCAKMAAVSYGTNHASTVSTPLPWIFKNAL